MTSSKSCVKTYLTSTTLLLLSINWAIAASLDQVRNCDYRTASARPAGNEDDEDEYQRTEIVCSRESPFCFAYWIESNVTGEVVFLEQGCWGASPKTPCESDSCITTVYKNKDSQKGKLGHKFCCCSSNNCNNNVTIVEVEPPPVASWESEESQEEKPSASSSSILTMAFVGSSIAVALFLVVLTLLSYLRKNKQNVKDKLDNIEAGEKLMEVPTNTDDTWEVPDQVVLGQELARGKFGTVYSGITGGVKVALKVFTADQREFFVNERFIYQAMGETTGKNILKYHGWKEFSSTLSSTNLILVLDKIVPGSLRDFLQSTNLTLSQAMKLMKGIANGLSYLHGENKNGLVVAHRDLTSKNILVDGNYTAYISDFGLSLQTCGSKYFFAGKERQAEFNSLAEAGTLRYMAPELLEGAVNLKDCENALKQVDIYAVALLLWEIGHVCLDIRLGEDKDKTYALPYETEIGKDITMETLTRFVVTRRDRPSFSQWRDTAVSRGLRDTLNESWDPEPDARLTSLCIVERLNDISQLTSNKSDSNSTTPLESLTSSQWAGRNSCLERNLLDRSEDKSVEYLLTSEKHRNPFYGNNSTEGESVVTMNTDLSNGSGLTPTVAVGPAPIPFLQNIRRV